METDKQVKVFKALGDPTRLMIIKMLANCEKCVCEIIPATGKSQPTTSAHLKILHEAGLVKSRKEGLSVYYRLSDESVKGLIKASEKIR
jgi:ArsR family transcriptional regulator, arsenate/arsenite/antimonite-responsive transcriptional repressor